MSVTLQTGNRYSENALKERPGLNVINILGAVFVHADPKSAKKTVKLSFFFVLLGSACVKAAHRMLMKLTLGINVTNIYKQLLFEKISQKGKKTLMIFALLGSVHVIAACIHVDETDT